MAQQRILFVDDEPQLLGGLRRMLWDRRGVWEMHFAEGGAAALALLEQTPMDLVVSDVRMPGMDGPEFLEAVRRRWPGTVRMILSGHSDREFVYRSIKPAHQYLSKPCTPQELKATIDRVLGLREIFTDERLRETVARIDSLPVLPAVFAELTEELRSPNTSFKTLGLILDKDIGLAAGLLKLVNSSFFGLPRRVASTEQAVTLLGLETVRTLVLSHSLFSRFDSRRYPNFGLSGLWEHSLGVARLAKNLAVLEGAGKPVEDVCFMAGLVHDAGKLILADLFEAEYSRVLETARTRNITTWQAEMEILGVSHAEIGAYLLGLWGFEESVVLGVARHHQPGLTVPGAPLAVPAVHAANALEHALVVIHLQYAEHPLDTDALTALGLGPRLEAWREAGRSLFSQGDGLAQ
ncbi:response regulator [Desulfovibrio sp. TomC]|uniref:response regulator n=1 Tax=Desulfovibrio sp. TomC TaxID=1562888 RepID=UPI0005736572|nr:response regulator [Desulfovibrio sp. TomC]KHK03802.1 putative signal transduction protein [Desulfovibrio sp. TomC]